MYKTLAETIVEYLSEDARYCWPGHHKSPERARQVAFRFSDPVGPYASELNHHWSQLLAEPYVYEYEDKVGFPLILAQDEVSADALVIFTEEVREGTLGLSYEIHFPTDEDIFPGWFALLRDEDIDTK
jgi:hypothetical protein